MLLAAQSGVESRLRFGVFEVDFDQWLLTRSGVRLKLQRKPFQILRALLQRRGDLVTRAELAHLLWPDLHVEYERSLNTAVNCLRQVLGDTPRSSRYIETCPGLGYRFVAPVEALQQSRIHPAVSAQAHPHAASPAEADYRRGRFFFDKMTPDNLARAEACFESARRADPGFAPAHAGLAEIQALLAAWGLIPSRTAGEQTLRHAQAALAADPESPEGHVALANAHWLLCPPPNPSRAANTVLEADYLRALSIDPSCFSAHIWLASLLSASARHHEAAKRLDAAQRIDSLSLLLHYQTAWAAYTRRAYHDAIEHSWSALMLDPAFAPAQYTLGLAYEQLGMLDEALTEFGNAHRSSNGHPAILSAQAHALAKAGLPTLAATAELEQASRRGYCSRYWSAVCAVGQGDAEAALDALENAVRAGDCLVAWAGVDPRFDPLRGSSRFPK